MLKNVGLRKSVEQPVLDLNFAASQIGSNGAPDARMNDFNRGSNAWFVDSDGLVKKSPHNLLLQSEDFGTSWTASGDTTVATNEIVAPDGTTTADKISSADFSLGANHVRQQVGLANGTVNMSAFVKDGGLGTIKLRTITLSPSTDDNSSIFTFSSESWTNVNAKHTNTFVENYGNGWYRIGFDVNNPATGATGGVQMRLSAESGNGFIYLWGAQISQHTTLPVGNPYIKTEGSAAYAARLDHDPTWFMSSAQEQNLLRYSEMLDDSGWTKLGGLLQVTANAEEAPDGTTTAEYIFANSPSGQFPQVHQDFDAKNGATHTLSFYAKAAERDVIKANLSETDGTFVSTIILETDISTTEWTRFSATFTASSDAHRVVFLIGDGAQTWSGSQGLYLWGLQVEVGSTASTYHRTEGAPYYGPGATPKGLLIEEQRANLIQYSEEFDNAAWSLSRASVTANAVLAPDGTLTGDKLVEDTTASNTHQISDAVSNLTAQPYTFSVFAKAGERDHIQLLLFTGAFGSNVARADFDLTNETSSTVSGTVDNSSITAVGNGWYRVLITVTATTTGSGTAIIYLADDGNVGYTGDGSSGLYIWGAQIEAGSFPTSYIQTTGSTATRNADVAVMGPTTGGTELVTNGTFDTDTSNWGSSKATLSSESGKLRVTSTGGSYAQANQFVSAVIGRRYRLTADVDFGTSSLATVQINAESDGSFTASEAITADGSASIDFTADTATPKIILHVGASTSAGEYQEFDNVSVRELYPFEQYRPDQGTMVVAFDTQSDASRGPWWFSRGGASSTGWGLRLQSTTTFDAMVRDSSNFNTIGNLTITPAFDILAASYEQRASDTFCTIATATNFADDGHVNDIDVSVDTLDIGNCLIGGANSGIMSGHIKRLQYFPIAMNDATKLKNMCDD